MEELELKRLIQGGETSKVQFKERAEDSYKMACEMVAFSNSKGGLLVIGVNDKNGEIKGLDYFELQKANSILANAASENVKPSVAIFTESVFTSDGVVLVAEIKEGLNKPYKDNKGIIWVKNGSDKRKVFDNSELVQMMETCGNYEPDRMPVVGSSMADVDENTLHRFLTKRFRTKLLDAGLSLAEIGQRSLSELADLIVPGQNIKQLLQNLDLMNAQDELVWASELLFGKKPQHYEPVYTVKCIYFMGTSVTSTVFRDKMNDSVLEGNLLQMYGFIMDFLRRNLRNIQVESGFNSAGELEIPYESLIEIVVNALIHRDYAVMAPIRVFVFDDRVEVISPGSLPCGLSANELYIGTSCPRNKILFNNAIHLLPYTGAGSGIRRALEFDNKIRFENLDGDGIHEFKVIIPRIYSKMYDNLNREPNIYTIREPSSPAYGFRRRSGNDGISEMKHHQREKEDNEKYPTFRDVDATDISHTKWNKEGYLFPTFRDVRKSKDIFLDSIEKSGGSVLREKSSLEKTGNQSLKTEAEITALSALIDEIESLRMGKKVVEVLSLLKRGEMDRKSILMAMGLGYQANNVMRVINPIITWNLVDLTSQTRKSKLRISSLGERVLDALGPKYIHF
ncbi:MAG TPA: putative DNA binding domain-containing protein [Paludibacteraceae bacterium]|nr:putative DNA binding domain-containing protein [Paludibacteraceae bacterium]HPH62142.1 putative DNA binding domain-containing protein [Paludibacteraceae bacterium]